MLFSEQYAALEVKFKEQVEKDNEDFKPHGFESNFLANIAPKCPVDYILVAMEPSFGGGPGIPTPGKALNSRNFAGSLEDFILHYCVSEYLCEGERNYYLTDLSKGAMPVARASGGLALRYERYKRWYPLLCEEIELVGPNAPIIPWGTWCVIFLKCRIHRISQARFCTTHRARQPTDQRYPISTM